MDHLVQTFLGALILLLIFESTEQSQYPWIDDFSFQGKVLYRKFSANARNPCPNGIENCSDFPLDYVPTPRVTYRKNPTSKVEMVCSFGFPNWNNVSFFVEWIGRSVKPVKTDKWCIPGQPKDDQNICSRRESSIFLPDHFALGDMVWCALFMKFSTEKTNPWTSIPKKSNTYYVGVEATPKDDIRVPECETAVRTIRLRPTIPIIPTMNIPGSDTVVVSVIIPKKYKRLRNQVVLDRCKVELKTEDIVHGKEIRLRGLCDNLREEVRSYCFRFKAATSSQSWSNMGNYRMSSVQVTVDNKNTKLCYSTSDPHLFTFDNSYLFYNNLGDYMMYNNEAKKIQVHVRLWICSSDRTCICGAAIREGKDLIEISICNTVKTSAPTVLRTIKRSPGPLSKGIEILKQINGASLDQEVILSSGTRISVYRSGRSLDVRINEQVRFSDVGKVSGLCGNNNGDKSDDFHEGGDGKYYRNKDEFANSWRLSAGKSFFEILPDQDEEVEEKEKEKETEKGDFCHCQIEGEVKWDEKCDFSANNFARIDKMEVVTQLNGQSLFGLKRSIDSQWYSDDIIDQEGRSYFVDDQHAQHVYNRIRNKRSPKQVITHEEATKYCRRQIEESTAGRTCKGISDSSIQNAMIQCINDLKMTGDKTFAPLAFDTMKYVCEDTLLTGVSHYTESPSGALIPPTTEVKDLCPTDCSGHGRCKDRRCICDEGFTALDCSMKVNAVPQLMGIYNGGLCDIRERPCLTNNLFGQNFISSENLTCHVKEVKVFPGPWSPREITIKTKGKVIDIYGVKCNLPEPPTKLGDYEHEGTPAGGLLISVSNDGFNKSTQQLRHLSYDSKCIACSKSGKCEQIANSCLIRGHCFAANEPNPRDWCQQCLPGDDQKSWTRRTNNQAPRFTLNKIYNAIQGEDIALQLKATDPDNRPVTFSVLSSTATGYKLSRSGLVRWKVTSNENKMFTFKVTDECGKFNTIDVTVRIVQCPCFNGGKCVPHPDHPRGSGQYQCNCVNGESGDRCEVCQGIVDNKAPKFTTKTTIFAVQGEDLSIQIRATDPENRPITYSVLRSTATGYTFSPSGLLRWRVTSNQNKRFTFRVSDECRASDTIDVTVRIKQCPCLHGGRCVPHPDHPRGSGQYQCRCLNGDSGDRCEKVVVKGGERVPDAAPVITQVLPTRYDAMRVTWLPIHKRKRNGIIRGYKIYYKERHTNQKWIVVTAPAGELTSTINGLRPYTEYCVKMSAFTSKGEFPDWDRKQCNGLRTPSLPINVTAKALSSTEILLKFVKPLHSVASYRVQVDYGKQKSRLNKKKACYGSSCVINKLDENTLYYFKVIGYIYQKGESPSFTQIRTLPRGS